MSSFSKSFHCRISLVSQVAIATSLRVVSVPSLVHVAQGRGGKMGTKMLEKKHRPFKYDTIDTIGYRWCFQTCLYVHPDFLGIDSI